MLIPFPRIQSSLLTVCVTRLNQSLYSGVLTNKAPIWIIPHTVYTWQSLGIPREFPFSFYILPVLSPSVRIPHSCIYS